MLMRIPDLIFLLAACSLPHKQDRLDFQNLSAKFYEPPISSRPGAFWCWLNGDVTKASITHDLEEMKAKGICRAEIWDGLSGYNFLHNTVII